MSATSTTSASSPPNTRAERNASTSSGRTQRKSCTAVTIAWRLSRSHHRSGSSIGAVRISTRPTRSVSSSWRHSAARTPGSAAVSSRTESTQWPGMPFCSTVYSAYPSASPAASWWTTTNHLPPPFHVTVSPSIRSHHASVRETSPGVWGRQRSHAAATSGAASALGTIHVSPAAWGTRPKAERVASTERLWSRLASP